MSESLLRTKMIPNSLHSFGILANVIGKCSASLRQTDNDVPTSNELSALNALHHITCRASIFVMALE